MFKDFGDDGTFAINNDFMTNADAPTLLTTGITERPTNPATGNAIDSRQKADGALVCTDDIFMPYQNGSAYIFTAKKDAWYRVRENIFKSENWVQETQK